MQVQFAGLEQRLHLVPGLVHASAIDALHRDALKNYVFGKVQRDGLGGQAEQGDATTASHNVEPCSDGVGVAGHLQHHVNAQSSRRVHHRCSDVVRLGIEHV